MIEDRVRGSYKNTHATIIIPSQSLLAQSSQTANALGLMLMVFSGALLFIAHNYNRNIYRSLLLRYENSELVRQMSAANASLEFEIRERQHAEYELSRDRKLFTNGPVTVFRWRAVKGWPIEYASKTDTQFGYDDEELVRTRASFADMIVRTDLRRVEKAKFNDPDGRYKTVGIDYRIVRSDGEVRWVYDYTVPVRNRNSEITHYAGYLLDITDRKQAESDLLREKERIQITLHSIMDAVITTDVNGQVEYLNLAAEELTGWDGHIVPIRRGRVAGNIRVKRRLAVPGRFIGFQNNDAGARRRNQSIAIFVKGPRGTLWIVFAFRKGA